MHFLRNRRLHAHRLKATLLATMRRHATCTTTLSIPTLTLLVAIGVPLAIVAALLVLLVGRLLAPLLVAWMRLGLMVVALGLVLLEDMSQFEIGAIVSHCNILVLKIDLLMCIF